MLEIRCEDPVSLTASPRRKRLSQSGSYMLLTPTKLQPPVEGSEPPDAVEAAAFDDRVGVGALATATGGPGCLNLTKNHSGVSGLVMMATSSERRAPHSSSRWMSQVPA